MTVNILALGDSLTWGVSNNNVGNGDQSGGYRTFLQDSLDAAGFQNPTDIDFVGTWIDEPGKNRRSAPNGIDNDHEGRRGNTIADLNTALTANSNSLLTNLAPDIVLLMAGTNDLLQDSSATVALSRLNSLLTTLVNSGAQVLVATLPPFVKDGIDDVGGLNGTEEEERVKFNNALPTALANAVDFDTSKVTLVDIAGALQTTDVSSDGVHLLSTGFSKIATAWHNALVPLLDPAINPSSITRGTPIRIEAEDFDDLGGFTAPPQSGDGLPDLPDGEPVAIRLTDASGPGTATTVFDGATGYYDVTIGYFDENDAVGAIDVTVGQTALDSLSLNQDLGQDTPSTVNYAHTTIGQSIQITDGDQISLTGTPGIGGNNELVWIDYLELVPVPAPSPNPSPGPSPGPSPNPSPGPSPGPSPNPSPGPSPGPSPNPSPGPSPGPSPNPSPGPSPNPSPTPGLEVKGSKEDDLFDGTAQNDIFKGKGGKDNAKAGDGDDLLVGGTGNDKLFGEKGNDILKGGSGRDRLVGGDGEDELMGGRDVDTLQGNKGADMFVYTNKKDGGKKGDKIRGFDVTEDTLVFKGKAFDDAFKRDRTLKKKFFTIGSKAKRANHRFIYNDQSGLLSFDSDGKGGDKALKIARLDAGLDLDQSSIFII